MISFAVVLGSNPDYTCCMRFPRNPRAVITGAASGFGRALSERLAARGARLLLSDIDTAGLEQTKQLVAPVAREVHTVTCDVSVAQQVRALSARADDWLGGTDILVNNAGVAVAGKVGEVSLDDWRWQIDINLWGVVYGCHYFIPKMVASKQGWILNVASSAGLIAGPLMAPYNVSKAGVIALSETLCSELRDTGVSTTVLCPTFFQTNIHRNTRTTSAKLNSRVESLVTRSKWTAEAIADVALRAAERGELHVIPQWDGKLLWAAKRLSAKRFHRGFPKVLKVLGLGGG